MAERTASSKDSEYKSDYEKLKKLFAANLARDEYRDRLLRVIALRIFSESPQLPPQDSIHVTHLWYSANDGDEVTRRQVFELSPTGLLSSSVEKFGVYPRQPRIEIDLSNPVVKHRLEMYAIRSTLKAPNVSPSQQIPIPT